MVLKKIFGIIVSFIVMFASSLRFLNIFKSIYPRDFSSATLKGKKRIRSKMDLDLKCRENPVVTKLDTEELKTLFTQEVRDLKTIFDKYQFEIRIAGGAVRDLLMGLQPKDLDFATTATPQQMKDMFTEENVRMINLSGEKHGTITPRINDKENFEVTTLRVDLVTDGRHAEIEYTTDWKLDANRRDLTVNSMFLGFDGSVYDYFFGYDDLQKRRVAFVGDADVRIKEDYLRIMRYFRFYGRIAEKPDAHEVETLEIIKNNTEGLQNVSGERIWMELKKTLQGNFAGSLMKVMLDTGLGPYIGLPTSPNTAELDKLIQRAEHLTLHPMSYLAALLIDLDEALTLHKRLKFSSFDRDFLCYIIDNREEKVNPCADTRPLLPYEKLVLNSKIKPAVIVEYITEILKYRGDKELLDLFNKWEKPRFPLNGKIMKENGIPPGIRCGKIMEQLKIIWIENEYKQSADNLVKLIPSIVEEIETEIKSK